MWSIGTRSKRLHSPPVAGNVAEIPKPLWELTRSVSARSLRNGYDQGVALKSPVTTFGPSWLADHAAAKSIWALRSADRRDVVGARGWMPSTATPSWTTSTARAPPVVNP